MLRCQIRKGEIVTKEEVFLPKKSSRSQFGQSGQILGLWSGSICLRQFKVIWMILFDNFEWIVLDNSWVNCLGQFKVIWIHFCCLQCLLITQSASRVSMRGFSSSDTASLASTFQQCSLIFTYYVLMIDAHNEENWSCLPRRPISFISVAVCVELLRPRDVVVLSRPWRIVGPGKILIILINITLTCWYQCPFQSFGGLVVILILDRSYISTVRSS